MIEGYLIWILPCGHSGPIDPRRDFRTLIDYDCWDCYIEALNQAQKEAGKNG